MWIMSWSGGKDSCLACWKAIQAGYKISHLVNFISAEYKRVSFHGVEAKLIQMQSDSIGIPLLQKEVHPDDYEPAFKEAVQSLLVTNSEQRVERESPSSHTTHYSLLNGMVFGDIYLQEHRQWTERICSELGIQSFEPLWGMRTEDILNEFINSEFEAIIVSAKAAAQFGPYGIDKEWIGHKVDDNFIRYLKTKPYIDLCGEGGEYHTLVINGPLFKRKINITDKKVIEKHTPWGLWYFLDVSEYKLMERKIC